MHNSNRICILGGTGFVGRTLVRRLAGLGYEVNILSRHPERNRDLLIGSGIRLFKANVHNEHTLQRHFLGCAAVINLVGILNEFRYQTFRGVHVDLPGKVMRACWKTEVPLLLHMSALNADAGTGTSQYLRTKGEAEDLLHVDAGDELQVIRFRPSVIFGAGDRFFNRFASLLRRIPVFFPLACANARFAPVYVGDVADAFVAALRHPATSDERYSLCGPKSYSLKELVEYTAMQIGVKRRIIPLGRTGSRLQAAFLGLAPGKPFTLDNYHSMQIDSVCHDNGLARLGISATPLEAIVPGYLSCISERSRYDVFRRNIRS